MGVRRSPEHAAGRVRVGVWPLLFGLRIADDARAMKIAFYVPRLNHLKIVGPVAAAARRRGYECVMLSPVGTLCGPKDDVGRMLGYDPALKPFDMGIGIADATDAEIHLRDVDWAVAVGLRTAPAIRAYTRASGVKWAALDHVGDNLLYVLEYGEVAIKEWDCVTTLAPEPRDAAAAWSLEPVGYPELDQLALSGMTRDACRAKWNLPAKGNIVLFAPAARPANLTRLYRWWWGRHEYPFIVRQVRRFCDRQGALLVTKTRAKHGDPPWLQRMSDRYIGETCYYPFDALELVVAADLVVGGFASALAVEAAAAQRCQVWLQAWPLEASEWPRMRPLRQPFFSGPGGLWNHAGARTLHCFGPRWREHLRHWAEWGAWPVLTDSARGQNSQAVTRWAGPIGGASERFLELLEARHG